ncbi:MAG: type II toxin-antitoxin system HicA family toxin [Acidobacteria bacterium]|nr:type II toxin-antitoxin system HicA family toxin [Acidobacteriota bacterium]
MRVASLVDDAHTAFTELGLDAVVVERLADHWEAASIPSEKRIDDSYPGDHLTVTQVFRQQLGRILPLGRCHDQTIPKGKLPGLRDFRSAKHRGCRTRGSHHYLRKPGASSLVTVPVHGNHTLPAKTLQSIRGPADRPARHTGKLHSTERSEPLPNGVREVAPAGRFSGQREFQDLAGLFLHGAAPLSGANPQTRWRLAASASTPT